MKYKDFDSLSGKARIAYASLCLEKYVLAKYPDVDFSEVIEKAGNVADNLCSVDENVDVFGDLIPEYLYERPYFYKDGFGYLTEEDYEKYTKIIPSDDTDLNTIMKSIFDLAIDFGGDDVRENSTELNKILFRSINVLEEQGIELPDLAPLLPYNNYEGSGWGCAVPYSKFSYILDDDKYNKKDPYSLRDFDEISLYGHISFALLCLENYVLEVYPDTDYAPIVSLVSKMVRQLYSYEDAAKKYWEVISYCFPDMEYPQDFSISNFTQEQLDSYASIINSNDENLKCILIDIYKIASAYDFKWLPPKSRKLAEYVFDIIDILKLKGIEIPQLEPLMQSYKYATSDGFGYPIPYEQYSQILI